MKKRITTEYPSESINLLVDMLNALQENFEEKLEERFNYLKNVADPEVVDGYNILVKSTFNLSRTEVEYKALHLIYDNKIKSLKEEN